MTRIITREMLREGYMVKIGDRIARMAFTVLHDRGDGTYVVEEPRRVEPTRPLVPDAGGCA